MISNALNQLPSHSGTKKEILDKIEEIYGIQLPSDSPIYKTLEQSLSKYFGKTPQEYILNPEMNLPSNEIGGNPCMK